MNNHFYLEEDVKNSIYRFDAKKLCTQYINEFQEADDSFLGWLYIVQKPQIQIIFSFHCEIEEEAQISIILL